MERIYDQAKDVHVATYVLYAKTADKKLYLESSYTTQVTKAELEAAFKKGRLEKQVSSCVSSNIMKGNAKKED